MVLNMPMCKDIILKIMEHEIEVCDQGFCSYRLRKGKRTRGRAEIIYNSEDTHISINTYVALRDICWFANIRASLKRR